MCVPCRWCAPFFFFALCDLVASSFLTQFDQIFDPILCCYKYNLKLHSMGKMRSKWQQFDKNYFTCLPAYGITACYLLLPSKFWSDFPIIFLPLIFADDLILIVQYFLAILCYMVLIIGNNNINQSS